MSLPFLCLLILIISFYSTPAHSIGKASSFVKSTNSSQQPQESRSKSTDELLQEKIWAYERSGDHKRAEGLKETLVNIFAKGHYSAWNPVLFSDLRHFYISMNIGLRPNMRLLKFESNVKGVFKPTGTGSDPNAAIAAYQVDQLFHFSLVPMIIGVVIDGTPGSLQYFVPNARIVQLTNIPFNNQQHKELELFDYLTGLGDRSPELKNFLVRPDGQIVAIDNDFCFGHYKNPDLFLKKLEEKIYSNPMNYRPSDAILEALRNTPDEIVFEKLTPFTSEDNIKEFLMRKKIFLKGLSSE